MWVLLSLYSPLSPWWNVCVYNRDTVRCRTATSRPHNDCPGRSLCSHLLIWLSPMQLSPGKHHPLFWTHRWLVSWPHCKFRHLLCTSRGSEMPEIKYMTDKILEHVFMIRTIFVFIYVSPKDISVWLKGLESSRKINSSKKNTNLDFSHCLDNHLKILCMAAPS